MTNSFKTLAAAAVVAVAGSAAFAGPNYIIPGQAQSLTSTVNLDLVRADTNSTVYIYDFHNGERGALLGSEAVHAGANTNVKVQLSRPAISDAIAVLSNDGVNTLAVRDVNNVQ